MKSIEEKIAVMQAFVDGKKVEFRYKGCTDWEDVAKPAWNWNSVDYRVKQDVPRTWEEFCKQYREISNEYFINSDSRVLKNYNNAGRDAIQDANLLKERKDAEGLLAFIKLKRLRDSWWGDWKPYYDDPNSEIYYIRIVHYPNDDDRFEIWGTSFYQYFLVFKTKKMAEEFLLCFKDLIKQAEMWL